MLKQSSDEYEVAGRKKKNVFKYPVPLIEKKTREVMPDLSYLSFIVCGRKALDLTSSGRGWCKNEIKKCLMYTYLGKPSCTLSAGNKNLIFEVCGIHCRRLYTL